MTPKEYLAGLPADRKELLTAIHNTLLDVNMRVKPVLGGMMAREMIQYKINDVFMYALHAGKNHNSLHMLPMYGSPEIRTKYSKLLNKVKFQKGCINFTKAEQMPMNVVKNLLKDCLKGEQRIIDYYLAKNKKK